MRKNFIEEALLEEEKQLNSFYFWMNTVFLYPILRIKMILLVTILALFSMLQRNSCTNILHDVIGMLKKENNLGCNVTDFQDQLICNYTIVNNLIPHGQVCDVIKDNRFIKALECYNGYIVLRQTRIARRKRQSFEQYFGIAGGGAGIGAAIGGAFGPIGGAIGAVIGAGLGSVFCLIFCSEDSPPSVNKPPSITCEAPIPSAYIDAEPLETSVEVRWPDPVATDPEGGVSISGGKPESGSEFGHGRHIISYTATDDVGNMAVCSVSFQVTVHYCRQSLFIRNGHVVCDRDDKLLGTKCSFECYNGYELSNYTAQITCELKSSGAQFTGAIPECLKKKCTSPGSLCNGNFSCTGTNYEYDSVCFPKCNDGFETEMSRNMKCNGDNWEGANTILDCEDAEPPRFVTCPGTLTRYTDRGTNTASGVTWNDPVATDNSLTAQSCDGTRIASPTVRQISGLTKGSDFPKGYHIITYEATDHKGLSDTCTFNVIIDTITCDPLIPTDNFIITRCPSGYIYGSSCQLSCFLSYVLKGGETVTCERNNSGTQGYWKWENDTESFCEKLDCPMLPAPANGALACSTVSGNQICTMSCNERYQTPLRPPSEFVCNDEQEWIQGLPPNCTKKRIPYALMMPGELIYFFSGDCNDSTVQQGIKLHFITVMEDMAYNRNWSNICPTLCNISDVSVTCGPVTGKRRRDVSIVDIVFKRSTNQIDITFSLTMEWVGTGSYWDNNDKIVVVSNGIKALSENGDFDYNGLSPAAMTFSSYGSIECEEGSKIDYFDELCRGCTPGTYLQNDDCQDCAKGYYQDEEYQISCKPCPFGTSTEGTGSSSIDQCLDVCSPGTFSATGVIPCSTCNVGSYQPLTESTSCDKCPKGQFTALMGATDISSCKAFDAKITDLKNLQLSPVSVKSDDFVIALWVFSFNSNETWVKIDLNGFNLQIGTELVVSHSGMTFQEVRNEFLPMTWVQVHFEWTQVTQNIKMYINGDLKSSQTFTNTIDGSLHVGNRLEILSSTQSVHITGFALYTSSSPDIFSRMCHSTTTMDNTVYSMSDLLNINGTELVESSCDEIDECNTKPCGEGNICINLKDDFNCTCLGGYSGRTCDVPPYFCVRNNCSNGATCESLNKNYTCHCAAGFKGPFCQIEIVNGNWGTWLEWSECSKSCDRGTRTRQRFCDKPAPEEDGLPCHGSDNEVENCKEDLCPACKPFYTIMQFKNSFNCTESTDYISCEVTCRDGYVFMSENSPLDKYECGFNTSYQWNAIPPACSHFDLPSRLSTATTVPYKNVSCSEKENIKNQFSSNIQVLECVTQSTCELEVVATGCTNATGESMTFSDLELTVTMTSTFADTNSLELEELYSSKIVSQGLADLIDKYAYMTKSVVQMANDTEIFILDVNGQKYTTNVSAINLISNVECSIGKVKYQAFCVPCPTGTYWKDGLCVLCSIGTYQDEIGQTECKACPPGFTTLYRSSRNETDCSSVASDSLTDLVTQTPPSATSNAMDTSNEDHERDDDESGQMVTLIAVVVSVLVLLVAITTCVLVSKYIKKSRLEARLTTRTMSRASFAAFNMVHPSFMETPEYIGVPPMNSYA